MFSPIEYLIRSSLARKVPGNRPVVIIESDDWGTIRMASNKIFNHLASANPAWVNDPYLKYDAIESNEDLEKLFEVLRKHKDGDGKHPVLTANCVAGNPNFYKIRDADFNHFFWEDFRDTLMNYPGSDRVFELEIQGLREGIFIPQFHAKEHIQTSRWMTALKAGNNDLRRAFDLGLISHATPGQNTCASFFMDAFNADNALDLERIVANCREGLEIFNQTWGFSCKTMIAPCYYWHNTMEEKLMTYGIKAFQGIRVQKVSKLNNQPADFRKSYHFNGERSRSGQLYFVRNCFFEPSLDPVKYGSDTCLRQIDKAFRQNGIAIISAHRLNFIGRINPVNRDVNLKSFDHLLSAIIMRYPSVRFLSSHDLVDLYKAK